MRSRVTFRFILLILPILIVMGHDVIPHHHHSLGKTHCTHSHKTENDHHHHQLNTFAWHHNQHKQELICTHFSNKGLLQSRTKKLFLSVGNYQPRWILLSAPCEPPTQPPMPVNQVVANRSTLRGPPFFA